jgi:adenine phosphoribosyltransferase
MEVYMANLRFIEDFPKKGVKFIDITPKLADKDDFKNIIDKMCAKIPEDTDYIITPESRGYIFGAPISFKLNKGLVLLRKHGKLPDEIVFSCEYKKEYGTDIICLPKNENYSGKKFYFVDDVLATGGTLNSCRELVKQAGGEFIGAGVYINIAGLNNENIDSVEKM